MHSGESGAAAQKEETAACRTYSLISLLLLNAVICGLEFCASAGFTYIPPILLKAGVPETQMSVALSGGPALGVFMVPVIARLSDRCTSRYGRRVPFIAALGGLVVVSMVLIPYGQTIGRAVGAPHLGVALICIGVVLLDFATAACFNPCEALFSDMFQNTANQNLCFVVYSSMISVGGCIGNLITALDWTQGAFSSYLGNQERSAFGLLTMMFLVTLVCTIATAKDRPHKPRPAADVHGVTEDFVFERDSRDLLSAIPPHVERKISLSVEKTPRRVRTNSNSYLISTESDSIPNTVPIHIGRKASFSYAHAVPTAKVRVLKVASPSFIARRFVHRSLRIFVLCFLAFVSRPVKFVGSTFADIVFAPVVLRRLFVAHLSCWTALYCHNLFYTDFVGHAVYGGVPNAEEDSFERNMYDLGVRAGSWGLFLHCITSAAFSTVLDRVVNRVGMHATYLFGMGSFTLAAVLSIFVRDIYVLSVVTALTGFAFAVITVVPFTLVAEYHNHRAAYFPEDAPTRRTSGGNIEVGQPRRGVGADMAVLDTAYFAAQIIVSSLMGYIVHLTGTVLAYMVTASVLGVISCWCSARIVFDKSYMPPTPGSTAASPGHSPVSTRA